MAIFPNPVRSLLITKIVPVLIFKTILIIPLPVFSQEPLQDYQYWADLCQTSILAQKYTEAQKNCQTAISFNTKDPLIWQQLGEANFALENYSEALPAYEQLLKLTENNAFAQIRRCETLYHLQLYQDAIAACKTALQIDQNWQTTSPQRAWYLHGESFRKLNQPENALFSYDWAIQLQKNYLPGWMGRCLVFFEQKKNSEALKACQNARQSENGDGLNPALPWLLEGRIYRQLDQYEQALTAYEQAIALNPNEIEAWTEKAIILGILGRHSQALAANQWAMQIDPNDSFTLTQHCAILNRLNQNRFSVVIEDYQKALESCEQALQKGNGRWGEEGAAFAWNQRGNALIGLERYEEALVSLDQAIDLQPNYGEAWSNRAVALWYLEQYEQALTSVEQAIKLSPTSSQALFNKGTILTTIKHYEQAIMAYDRALEGDIQLSSSSAKAPILVNQSAVFWRLQLYEQALTTAQTALTLNPEKRDKINALYNQSLALISLQRYSQGDETLQQLLELDPENIQVKKIRDFLANILQSQEK